jgi:hypothetical protein
MTPRMLHIVIARTATEYVRNGVQVFETTYRLLNVFE